ncbi:MAG TPA: hypothetical protein VM163_12625 [bacterium]|nr:hypothetical protein [bacterium]
MSEDEHAHQVEEPAVKSESPEKLESDGQADDTLQYGSSALAIASIVFGGYLTLTGLLGCAWPWPVLEVAVSHAPILVFPWIMNVVAICQLRRRRVPRRWLVLSTAILGVGLLLLLTPLLLRRSCWDIAWMLGRIGFGVLVVSIAINNILIWARKNRGDSHAVAEVAGMTLALAGLIFILIPSFYAHTLLLPRLPRDDSPTRALSDCRNISTAILLFHKDTGMWPMFVSADHGPDSSLDYLYGNMGGMPGLTKEASESWGSRSEDMYFILVTNGRTQPWYQYGREFSRDERDAYLKAGKAVPPAGGWTGPYLPYVTDDPWGYAYLVSVSGFEGGMRPENHVWCLSAGPNHIVDTPAWATETHGDDVGYRHE